MIMVLSKTRGKLIVLIVSCDSREPQDAWAMANRLRSCLLRSCRPAQFLTADSDRGSVDDLASQRSLEDRSAPPRRSQHVSHQFPQNDALAIVDLEWTHNMGLTYPGPALNVEDMKTYYVPPS